jgi:hypothetical protein
MASLTSCPFRVFKSCPPEPLREGVAVGIRMARSPQGYRVRKQCSKHHLSDRCPQRRNDDACKDRERIHRASQRAGSTGVSPWRPGQGCDCSSSATQRSRHTSPPVRHSARHGIAGRNDLCIAHYGRPRRRSCLPGNTLPAELSNAWTLPSPGLVLLRDAQVDGFERRNEALTCWPIGKLPLPARRTRKFGIRSL